jgi:DNA recombination protein RmuC
MTFNALSLLFLFAGFVFGAWVGFLFGRLKAQGNALLVGELRQQISQKESEINKLHEELSSAKEARSKAEAQKDALEKLLQDEKEHLEKAQSELREAFKALSVDALKEAMPSIVERASQTFQTLQESAKGDLKSLVEPLKEQLEAYQRRLNDSEKEQAEALGKVLQQIEILSKQNEMLAHETEAFRMVLKSSQTRGKWGEETLKRVVEAAGMSSHCDFTEQLQEGDARPDLIVHLPGNRVIVVDAKVPDLDFLNAMDTADPGKRTQAREEHAKKLKQTIKDLASRNYPKQFPQALDYVVLFLPAESLFSAALEGDRNLIVWAAEQKILLATPASLIALLRAVALSWRYFDQTENARKIAEISKTLYERVTTFIKHFSDIGKGLEQAVKAYNEGVGSYERRILPIKKQLLDLGTASEKEPLEFKPVDTSLRELPFSEENP